MESEFLNLNEVFSQIKFHPVVHLPAEYEVLDFSIGVSPSPFTKYSIGKYNECRPGMYTSDLFGKPGEEHRDIHMGIDIGAPAATPVFTFYAGSVFCAAVNSNPGDYGGTIITEHIIAGVRLWALYGHLSHDSVQRALDLKRFDAGQVLGWLGPPEENGGWPPHLHFQLSLEEPNKCDMPGVVSTRHHLASLGVFVDPRVVLGNLY
jgi:murein DD-endopeptidase MepM/ murein hydrolase activator NlpD